MTESQIWFLWGVCVLICAAALGALWVRDSYADDDDRPDSGLDIMEPDEDRGDQDDATEAELHGWANVLHDLRVAPSPLLRRRLALDEHEPLTWEQRRHVFGVRIHEQRRRVRILTDETQPFDRVQLLEALLSPAREVPVVRSVWDENTGTWVKDTSRQLPLPLRGLRPVRGAR